MLLLSNYQQVTVPKEAIVARTGLRSDIHLRERPRERYIKVLNLAIVQVYSNKITQRRRIKTKLPACLLAGHT